jgi:hypothetical protein
VPQTSLHDYKLALLYIQISNNIKSPKMERLPGFNVANHFEKRQLLIAINCIAALSIFFFGYDLPSPCNYLSKLTKTLVMTKE